MVNLCVWVTSFQVWDRNLAMGTCHLAVEGWGPNPPVFCVLLVHDSAFFGLPKILIWKAFVHNTTVNVGHHPKF